MKIKITIGGNDRTAIILPIESAGLAAEIMALATIYERDGYYSTSGWNRTKNGVCIEYTEETELEPAHPLVIEAQKDAEKQRSEWYSEYQKRQDLEKQLAEVQAKLEGIQSVTSCTMTDQPAEPAHMEGEDSDAADAE